MTNYDVQNMYEQVLDGIYLDSPRRYDNEARIRCELLSRYLIVGSSGSMKTNTALCYTPSAEWRQVKTAAAK